jgi:transcriptional regulator with XRE-family HTH domain
VAPPRIAWPPDVFERLGVEKDEAIADSLGVSRHTVRALRSRMGIPMRERTSATRFDRLLGIVSDADLARVQGVTRQAVSARRQKRNIPVRDDIAELAFLMLDVREQGQEQNDGVLIPTDLYERICDYLSR